MSLKLSRNKVNHITKQIVDYIESDEDSDYNVDIGEVRKPSTMGSMLQV